MDPNPATQFNVEPEPATLMVGFKMWSGLFSTTALAIFFVWSFQGFGSRWFNVYLDPALCLIADPGFHRDLNIFLTKLY